MSAPGVLIPFVAVLGLSASACSFTPRTTPYGTLGRITLASGASFDAELLALQDTALIVARDSLVVIPSREIGNVMLDIAHERGWIAHVILAEAIPSVILIAASANDGASGGDILLAGIGGLAVTAGTIGLMLADEPTDYFAFPVAASKVEEFRRNTRYPQGLSDAQIAALRRGGTIQLQYRQRP